MHNIEVIDHLKMITTQEIFFHVTRKRFKLLKQIAKHSLPYSPSYNLTPPISRVVIGQHLIFYSLMSPTCRNSSRKCTPVKSRRGESLGF